MLLEPLPVPRLSQVRYQEVKTKCGEVFTVELYCETDNLYYVYVNGTKVLEEHHVLNGVDSYQDVVKALESMNLIQRAITH